MNNEEGRDIPERFTPEHRASFQAYARGELRNIAKSVSIKMKDLLRKATLLGGSTRLQDLLENMEAPTEEEPDPSETSPLFDEAKVRREALLAAKELVQAGSPNEELAFPLLCKAVKQLQNVGEDSKWQLVQWAWETAAREERRTLREVPGATEAERNTFAVLLAQEEHAMLQELLAGS